MALNRKPRLSDSVRLKMTNVAITTFYLADSLMTKMVRNRTWGLIYRDITHAKIVEDIYDTAKVIDDWVCKHDLIQDDVSYGDYYYDFIEVDMATRIADYIKRHESMPNERQVVAMCEAVRKAVEEGE